MNGKGLRGELEQGFALAWDGLRELSSEMISSVASRGGLACERNKDVNGWTALEGEME